MSERRRQRYGVPDAGPDEAPGGFVLADWLPKVGAGVEPMLRPVYARRAWTAAWAAWGRRNGYDPDALYATAEGRRWWEFRQADAG